MPATKHLSKIPRLALCVAVVAGLLLALLMAVSPELHGEVHHDAGGADHACLAITLAANGCDDTASAPFLPAFVAMVCDGVETIRSQWSEPSFLSACVLEHAPPRPA